MADKSFVLMSLKEDKVKKMTQVLNNDTCRQILDYLSNTERATATEISKKLKLAMSTVHYNLKQLKDNNLVTSDEYTYSEKGKEIIHYGLANKYIIIAPKEDKNVFDRLKGFLPITLISAFTGALLFLVEKNWTKLSNAYVGLGSPRMLMEDTSIKVADAIVEEVAPLMAEPTMMMAETVIAEPTTGMLIAPWFLAGAAFTIIVMVAYELARKKDE
jgi:DNA-binding transcriptional ArsR family regulator